MTTNMVAERARIAWSTRLSCAARAAFACAIVGGATLYGPKFLAHHIKYSAFSYLTTILIVSDASSLGGTLRGCWHAVSATVQVAPLAMLWLSIIGPKADVEPSTAAVGVAVAAFLVAMPEFTHLTAKKIAFGQIVLVCTVVNGGTSDRFMQPLYIGASTALGALASFLAFTVPYPSLASYKIRELCRVYAENASQRMKKYLQAFIAADEHTKMELISQAKPLSETGDKLLQSIRILQEELQWERPWGRVRAGQRLERMEQQMRGIEYSLLSSPSFPTQTTQEEQQQLSSLLENVLVRLKEKLQQVSCFSPSNSMIQSESIEKPSLPLDSTFPLTKHTTIFFFFSCIDTILNDALTTPTHSSKTEFSFIRTLIQKLVCPQRLEFSLKCSLSLSLAVFCGLLFDPENGSWAGLAIAISFVRGRQAIFTMANARAQGTAMGSVYGVICCFLFHYEEVRLLAILPWIIVCSIIRCSKMYGQTGGISAAIGALLILGRKNYGAPDEFAIARLAQVFIGLSAFIAVELFLQPFRAATLAKNHLFITLHALQDYIKETGTCSMQIFLESREKQRKLESLIRELKELVGDAELEPDFWYLPFRASCYQNMVKHLSNIRDMLHFVTYKFEVISKLLESTSLRDEFKEEISNEMGLLQESLKQAVSTESKVEDLEAGVLLNKESLTVFITEQREAGETTEDEEKKVMRHMSATGFCISSIVKELKGVRICLREINRWENLSSE
ncbi:hypothetical protein ACS0TY_016010 [Phlomoides rotata]